jgi:hypothetical protein
VALRYMGLMGYFEGNGFTTNPAGGLLVDYGGSNNAQVTETLSRSRSWADSSLL